MKKQSYSNKFLSVLCVFAFVTTFTYAIGDILVGTYGAGGGDGLSASSPAYISSAADLKTLSINQSDWNNHFQLTADIDMSAYDGTTDPLSINPIGYATWGNDLFFTGSFDGNSYTISNITIKTWEYSKLGNALFGAIDGATIKKLGVANVTITDGVQYAGGIAGYCDNSIIENCYVVGANITIADGLAGGIAGGVVSGTVRNCMVADCSLSASWSRGGIVGVLGENPSTVGIIENCIFYGDAITSGKTIVGDYLGNSVPTNCYYLTGKGIDVKARQASAAQLTNASSLESFDFTTPVWTEKPGYYVVLSSFSTTKFDVPALAYVAPAKYSGGAGIASNPYIINTPQDLVDLSANTSDYSNSVFFKMLSDIDMEGVVTTPIGTTSHPFSANIDGNNHTISNLKLTASTDNTGLIGLGQGAIIMNLGMINPNIDAQWKVNVGVIAGQLAWNTSKINNCFVQGGSIINGGGQIGAIVGWIVQGAITDSYTSCAVSGNWSVGGAVGRVGNSWPWDAPTAGTSGEVVSGVVVYGSSTDKAVIGNPTGGFGVAPTIVNNYYISTAGVDAAATSLTAAQLRDGANYIGFTFATSNWTMASNGFAILSSFGTKASEITITSSVADGNGTISPLGEQSVGFGENTVFTIAPDANYGATKLVINGDTMVYDPAATSYTFTAPVYNSTVVAVFEYNTATNLRQEASSLKAYGVEGAIIIQNDAAFAYKVIDLNGKVRLSGDTSEDSMKLSLSKAGIYVLHVQDDKMTTTKKVVVY